METLAGAVPYISLSNYTIKQTSMKYFKLFSITLLTASQLRSMIVSEVRQTPLHKEINMNSTKVIEAIEASDLWKRLNATCLATYEKEGSRPSDEEYQALRNILICQVMMNDESVKAIMAHETYEALRN